MEETADQANKDIVYHDTIAAEYDSVVVAPRGPANSVAFGKVARLVGRRESMLDVGCGTGHMLVRFGPQVVRALGVDHSQGMLDVARENVERVGCTNVKFIKSDAFGFLAKNTEKFDLITAVGFLHHLDQAALGEIMGLLSRALTPDGNIVIAEPVETTREPPKWIAEINRSSYASKLHYSVAATDPDEAPLSYKRLLSAIEETDLSIKAKWRAWEIFPRRETPTRLESLKIRYLNSWLGREGRVAFVVARKSR